MSIDISIKQEGVFKKHITSKTILGKDLSAGVFNGLRLDQDAFNESDFIAYNHRHIGRGFGVCIDQTGKKEVTLRVLTPTSDEELKDFYECVGRIMSFWRATLEVDGTAMPLSTFQDGYANMCDFNFRALKDMSNRILNGEHIKNDLFCAFWPLSMGEAEAKKFAESDTMKTFNDWLHEKQSVDAYYAKPSFFIQDDDSVVGRYVLTEGTVSIFPIKGYVPFGTVDNRTNKAVECDRFMTSLYSTSESSVIGILEYNDFIQALSQEKVHRYDESNILIDALPLDEMRGMLE